MAENSIQTMSGAEIIARLDQLRTDVSGNSDLSIAELKSEIDVVRNIANGKSLGKTFADIASTNAALAGYSNTELKVGDKIYIRAVGVPDRYVGEVLTSKGNESLPTGTSAFNDSYSIGYYKIYQLETEKVDLSDYLTINAHNTFANNELYKTAALIDNVIHFRNAAGVDKLTVSIATLLIEATNSAKGMVKLYRSADASANGTINDEGAFTPAYLGAILQNYTRADIFNALSQNVTAISSRVATLEADIMQVSVSDGVTENGLITFTWGD